MASSHTRSLSCVWRFWRLLVLPALVCAFYLAMGMHIMAPAAVAPTQAPAGWRPAGTFSAAEARAWYEVGVRLRQARLKWHREDPWEAKDDDNAMGPADYDKEAAAPNLTQKLALPGEPIWVFCAAVSEACYCPGPMRFGKKNKWKVLGPAGGKPEEVVCGADQAGGGDERSSCECALEPGSKAILATNPGLLPGAARQLLGAEELTNCTIAQGERGAHTWGEKRWAAMEGLCIQPVDWEVTPFDKSNAKGSKGISHSKVQKLMRAWGDLRFLNRSREVFKHQGWAARAFVVAYSGPLNGRLSKLTETLIDSVHKFSRNPIILINFGMAVPSRWTPRRYARLMVLHALPIPAESHRHVGMNKLRAALLAPVENALSIDADAIVGPGIDAMFALNQRQITEDYALPILPAHFLDLGPQNGGSWWQRFCKSDGSCPLKTARWGFAHPTWTFWALPFFGRWLRRNLRDETLPARRGMASSTLRVTDVDTDEYLLNVALWEDGGDRQWCIFTLPDPSEFDVLLQTAPRKRACSAGNCGHIDSDPRFYPHGVPKVFFSARHCTLPAQSIRYISSLEARRSDGDLPPPILFAGRFYRSGEELRGEHPEVKCLI